MAFVQTASGTGFTEKALRTMAGVFALALAMPAFVFVGSVAGNGEVLWAERAADGVWECRAVSSTSASCVTPVDLAAAASLGLVAALGLLGSLMRRRVALGAAGALLLTGGVVLWVRAATAITPAQRIGDFALGAILLVGVLIFALAMPARSAAPPPAPQF